MKIILHIVRLCIIHFSVTSSGAFENNNFSMAWCHSRLTGVKNNQQYPVLCKFQKKMYNSKATRVVG